MTLTILDFYESFDNYFLCCLKYGLDHERIDHVMSLHNDDE